MRTVVDLFAGCGGMSLGLEMAGFKTVHVNEIHPDAMSTFLANRSNSKLGDSRNHSFDIRELTRSKTKLDSLVRHLKREYGDIELVVGGPPCQGFSGIGHRRAFKVTKHEVPTNHLYRDMAKVISAIKPKAFVFENVRGLLNARWTPEGDMGEVWEDVQRAFRNIRVRKGGKDYRYLIDWELIYAKDYGVPQNRPRILLIGVREDVAFRKRRLIQASGLIPPKTGKAPDPIDLFSDLIDPDWKKNGETLHYLRAPKNSFQRYLRTNSRNGKVLKKGDPILEQEYSKHSEMITEKFTHMLRNQGSIPVQMMTKKFAQRVIPQRWPEKGPSITVASLPDDFVHFSQPRILTVREWARLQTFPDWYVFHGKRTTGGRKRAGDPDIGDWSRELPKYTQIGNAVPVLLAREIGLHLKRILG